MTFTVEFLRAVNDWQRGFSAPQKAKRAARLRAAAASLDARFRRADRPCYRQIALAPRDVREMGAAYSLPEAVSSWTESYDVAGEFKGGVPPRDAGWLGVMVRVQPTPDQVVLNLRALYEDPAFRDACRRHEPDVLRYGDGIGRYGATQAEVVLDVPEVRLADVYAIGGHSSADAVALLARSENVARIDAMAPPDRARALAALAAGRGAFGPRWLTGEHKDHMLWRWVVLTAYLTSRSGRRSADA